jgi:hypothetical protein
VLVHLVARGVTDEFHARLKSKRKTAISCLHTRIGLILFIWVVIKFDFEIFTEILNYWL